MHIYHDKLIRKIQRQAVWAKQGHDVKAEDFLQIIKDISELMLKTSLEFKEEVAKLEVKND